MHYICTYKLSTYTHICHNPIITLKKQWRFKSCSCWSEFVARWKDVAWPGRRLRCLIPELNVLYVIGEYRTGWAFHLVCDRVEKFLASLGFVLFCEMEIILPFFLNVILIIKWDERRLKGRVCSSLCPQGSVQGLTNSYPISIEFKGQIYVKELSKLRVLQVEASVFTVPGLCYSYLSSLPECENCNHTCPYN